MSGKAVVATTAEVGVPANAVSLNGVEDHADLASRPERSPVPQPPTHHPTIPYTIDHCDAWSTNRRAGST